MAVIWCVILLGVILNIEAKPFCKFDDESSRHLECSPGDTDYVLDKGLVSDNPRTITIRLSICKISSLSNDCFEGLPRLERLDIAHNKLRTLPLGVLDKVPKLTYFNASYNRIINLPVGLFDNIQNLIQLDLTGNHLYEINPGLIKKASILYLSKNYLQGRDIHPNVFEISDVNFLLLNENDMNRAPDNMLRTLRELLFLNLDKCSLTEVPKFITTINLDTVTHLTMADNKIVAINEPMFDNLKDLEVLNLTMNLLDSLNDNLFTSLKKLKKIDLSMNRLKVITEHQFQNTPVLSDVNLSYNFITILPVNAFRASALSNLDISNNRLTYLQDNFCLELKNSGAALRDFNFSKNPWQCACLRELLREVKTMNLKYDDVNYDGSRPVCVSAGQFVCKRQVYDNQVFLDMYDLIH
ncbi:PREDICTED: leucine-rich repeat-containing protein 15-like [Papilio xuthus]|uniref:Leucine-rich repeat-containing protein 15-like n=1 Tax=Papilio xuthus TaxID=66420 RepID=A0AAJ7E751_PAPXU|nr:PREDICTED: leucine-rich repeat-containing protein 15-like [Papilio xuthus]XP_013165604.1 PREDICTED: leucine-rich repeat-containing protein 15-like [Papilio xuthus]